MESSICRVCLENGDNLVNIFEETHQTEVSVADMISEWAGFKIERGDTFPETICPSCLQDAQNAYEMNSTYRRGHRLHCRLKKDPLEDSLKEEVYKEPDIDCHITNNNDSHPPVPKIKEEDEEELLGGQFQEKKESSKEEGFEEEYNPKSECKIKSVEEDKLQDVEDRFTSPIRKQPTKKDFQREYKGDDNLKDMGEQLKKRVQSQKSQEPLEEEVFEEEYNPRSDCDTRTVEDDVQENEVDWQAGREDGKINSRNKCTYCSKIFISKSALAEHWRKHIEELPKCIICSKTFQNSIYLQRHMKRHRDTLPGKCHHCSITFSSRAALHGHLRIHREKQQCIHCLRTFQFGSSLQKHLGTYAEERKLKCTHCSQTFPCNTHLQQHLNEMQPLRCPHCPKILKCRPALQNHIRLHAKERTYKCTPCAMIFLNLADLNSHLQTHSELGRPYKCPKCPRRFTTSKGVHLHERLHTVQQWPVGRKNYGKSIVPIL
ncbi:zinc finger protein 624 [Drosophila biarmipes]|uniref:zinc finger protein 624 n=1 Tax=Drosophila biarmipes TaxID=125945 RepID=UPI001CDA7165|nr:zinc finger protein 624 [Drosophila biarmipes]XP_050742740.1 zinc finger protein 624 [Drosophila biarmipes]XP_050742741.1 zinc finger protein 624 [Drosophila biarmipes]